MKINHQTLRIGLLGLCLSLPASAVLAADTDSDTSAGKRMDGSSYQTTAVGASRTATSASDSTAPGAPASINKASSLVGMEVKNGSDERLGKVKDIVIDLQSGKVSYVVLDGGTLLQSKMFAVPLNAFTASADQKSLILNTDKSRIQAAAGFDKNAWPSVNNPDWGATTFWEQPASTSSQPSAGPASTTPNDGNYRSQQNMNNSTTDQAAPAATPDDQSGHQRERNQTGQEHSY